MSARDKLLALVLLYEMSDIRSVTAQPAVPDERDYDSVVEGFYPISGYTIQLEYVIKVCVGLTCSQPRGNRSKLREAIGDAAFPIRGDGSTTEPINIPSQRSQPCRTVWRH